MLFSVSDGSLVPDSCCSGGKLLECTGKVNVSAHWPPRFEPPVVDEPTNYTLNMKVCSFSNEYPYHVK